MANLQRYRIVIALILILFVSACKASKPSSKIEWKSYEEAINEGKRSGKPVFILFSSRYCPMCERLEQEVLESSEILEILNGQFIPTKVEAERTPELTMHFRIVGFPTIWVYKKGHLYGPIIGYVSSSMLKEFLLEVLKG
jgi:thioredoxin-related protein